jgi:hypothetical protein
MFVEEREQQKIHETAFEIIHQFDAPFFYSIIRLLKSSTCFEQRYAHHQEVNCINTASGIVIPETSEWSKITRI